MDLEKIIIQRGTNMNVIEYVKQKHSGQKRKQGTPYYLHPVAVSKILKDKGFRNRIPNSRIIS